MSKTNLLDFPKPEVRAFEKDSNTKPILKTHHLQVALNCCFSAFRPWGFGRFFNHWARQLPMFTPLGGTSLKIDKCAESNRRIWQNLRSKWDSHTRRRVLFHNIQYGCDTYIPYRNELVWSSKWWFFPFQIAQLWGHQTLQDFHGSPWENGSKTFEKTTKLVALLQPLGLPAGFSFVFPHLVRS